MKVSVEIATLVTLALMMCPSRLAANYSMDNCPLPLNPHQPLSQQPHGLTSVAVLNLTVLVKALLLAFLAHR